MLTDVFSADGSGSLAREVILEAGTYDLGPKAGRIEDPAQWSREKIMERAKTLDVNKGPEGHFDD
jgi:fructose-bisphosphate aldolase class II